MNLVNMRYKTLGYLLTVLKSGRRVTTADHLASNLFSTI